MRLFDHRFDAFAAETHENLAPRALVAVGAGGVALTMLPWRFCLAWTMVALAIETGAWFASRPQFLRRAVTTPTHLAYLASLTLLIANWFLLAFLFWHTHAIEGAICATIIWLSILGFAQTFGSRTPLGFSVCGVAPTAGVFAVLLVDPLSAGMRLGPIVGILFLAVGFALAGARQTFANGRRFDETQTRLSESEAQYRTLADNISDVIGRTALDGTWRYISPSVEAMLGYTPEEFCALPMLSFVHIDDRPMAERTIAELLSAGGDGTVVYRLLRKDGGVTWTETRFSMVTDPATGEALELVSMSREINARMAMEDDLVQARERAEAAAAAKADFLANMTHELRTPLNAIVGFSGVLTGADDLGERHRRHARLINDASATLLVVVNSVLDFSKLESGGFELDPHPFDPAEMVRSVAMLLEDQAQSRGLRLEVSTDGELGWLDGDAPRLRQVVLNLLSNAVKFTSEGGVEALVQQRDAGAGRRRLRVTVRDTGIGIPGDQLDAVFERFSQADGSVSRRFGGTGLGLAICKRLVELMNGRIGVESREGEGSIFWFEIELPAASPVALVDIDDTVGLERPLRLLLVEDVAVNRELVRTVLADFDVEMDEAENGVEAVEAMARRDYDVVLMDVQMPVMDGLTATRRIRASAPAGAPRTPIIAMTANVLPEQVARCLEAGMDAHLGKPIEPGRLLETLAAWTTPQDEVQDLQATGT